MPVARKAEGGAGVDRARPGRVLVGRVLDVVGVRICAACGKSGCVVRVAVVKVVCVRERDNELPSQWVLNCIQ